MNETKVRILEAAERLVADHGLDVSLRAITAKAGVNLAAVNYHFKSKDALIDALIARRIEPVNRARLEMLDALEREFPSEPWPIERVVEAFIAPVLQMDAGEHIRILFGRLYSLPDEFLRRVFSRHLQAIADRFIDAFGRAIPDLPEADRMSCMLFTIGAMVHVMTWSRMIILLSRGTLTPDDTGDLTRRLVNFASAGFRDALTRTKKERQGILHA
jgi:AcrR family transcriptional regulator